MDDYSGSKNILQFFIVDWKVILLLAFAISVYIYYTSTFDFFEKRGVKYMKPTIFYGNMDQGMVSQLAFHFHQLQIYNYFKGNLFGGFFEGRRPVFIALDPELIKNITIKDFDYFVDRNNLRIRESGFLKLSLLNLKGLKWKVVRSTLTPAFSSARLKHMLPLIEHCSEQLRIFLKQHVGKDIELKDTLGHYTLEVIGACAFGIKCDAINNEKTYFAKVATTFGYMPKFKKIFIRLILTLMPQLVEHLSFSFLNTESVKELLRILQKAKSERRSTGYRSNDILQLMIDAVDKTSDCQYSKAKYLDEDTIDAQAVLFLIGGYETNSSMMSFAIHVLATRPELQDKLREHIQEHTDGKEISYELLSQLSYLEAFLFETLRMYPPVARVDRVCVKPYTVPGTTLQINTGDVITLPIYGIQMDADHFPEPEEFRPERFLGDAKKNRPVQSFLAFGTGPRNCIGWRFAMVSAKLAMVMLVKNFKFSVCDKTSDPIRMVKNANVLKAEGGLWVRLDEI